MMEFLFDKTITTKRLADVAGTDNEKFEDYLAGVSCHIQPLEESFGEDLEGSYGKSFLMFSEVVDIIEGDKVIDGSDEYMVVGKESYDFMGENHLEIIIRKCQ